MEAAREAAPCLVLQPQEDLPNSTVLDLLLNPERLTSNQSESFNAVLKRMQEWKEMPVDTAVLSLYLLQAYYWNEWQRGLAGVYLLTCDYNVLPT